jgi:hypothetical protein
MFYDQGCFGRVDLGDLPQEVADRLAKIPGEWLEYDPPSGAIVVRHVEPSTTHHLPAVACELVRLFAEIPAEFHGKIPGGALFVHTEEEHGQLIRLRVEAGGAIHVRWAHPSFKQATRLPYAGGSEFVVDPEIQRLNGAVSFEARDPEAAVAAVQDLAETFEGLYPAGDCVLRAPGEGKVELRMEDVNLDATLLIELLQKLAEAGTLSGRFQVSSFGTVIPENQRRVLFEGGEVLVQHPLLWPETSE